MRGMTPIGEVIQAVMRELLLRAWLRELEAQIEVDRSTNCERNGRNIAGKRKWLSLRHFDKELSARIDCIKFLLEKRKD